MEKKTATRPYLLTNKDGVERIVEATSQQQALFHAAKSDWTVGPLGVKDALRLAGKVSTEVAGAPANPAQLDAFPDTTTVDPVAGFVAASDLGS